MKKKSIEDKLNIKPIKETTALEAIAVPKPPVPTKNAPPLSEQDKFDDIQYARYILRDAIDKTSNVLGDAIMMAKTESSPRAYEAVGDIVDKITNMASKLVEIHKTVNDIEKKAGNKENDEPKGNTNILIATTKDIVEAIKEEPKTKEK